jgi:hypothetical protein
MSPYDLLSLGVVGEEVKVQEGMDVERVMVESYPWLAVLPTRIAVSIYNYLGCQTQANTTKAPNETFGPSLSRLNDYPARSWDVNSLWSLIRLPRKQAQR